MAATRAMKQRKRGVDYSPKEIVDLVSEMYLTVGEPVTYHRFAKWSGIPAWQIYLHFRSWYEVREAAGLPRKLPNTRCISEEQLLSELHKVVRELKRWPTVAEYQRLSQRNYGLLNKKIGPWPAVQARYREWLKAQPSETPPKVIDWWNLQSVMESMSQIRWMREEWLQARVGFELKSSDFHDRTPGDCDFLVVLDHDWPRCPVPVIEFGSVLKSVREPEAPVRDFFKFRHQPPVCEGEGQNEGPDVTRAPSP